MSSWTSQLDDLKNKFFDIINCKLEDWSIAKHMNKITVWQKPATDWKGTIYKTEGIIDAAPETVFDYINPHPDGIRAKWDSIIKQYQLIEKVKEDTKILRSVTHSAAMGLIASRDFVDIIVKEEHTDYIMTRGVGVNHKECPETNAAVRGYNFPCGMICYRVPSNPNSTRLVTIIQSNLNGMIPKALVESTLPSCQIDFFNNLTKTLKADGKI